MSSMENFEAGSNIELPTTTPGAEGGADLINQLKNMVSGQEKEKKWNDKIKKVQTARKASKIIIKTREELSQYLLKQRIKLVTSAVEFQKTGSFLQSSYVLYLDFGNASEKLNEFIKRYPTLVESVNQINKNLKGYQGMMQLFEV
jgi:hypothetical protein